MTHTHPTGTCPVCAGTGRVPGRNANEARACTNCGGQTMSMKATGQVRLRPDGAPCTHEYVGRNAGRCYTVYTCKHCGDTYSIDSSD